MVVSGCGWLWVVAYFSITFKLGVLKCRCTQILKESACFRVSLIKLQPSGHATLLKRYSNTCFPVKYAKFLRTPVLQNIPSGSFYPSLCMKKRKKIVSSNSSWL